MPAFPQHACACLPQKLMLPLKDGLMGMQSALTGPKHCLQQLGVASQAGGQSAKQ
jgi:hypothetical protein